MIEFFTEILREFLFYIKFMKASTILAANAEITVPIGALTKLPDFVLSAVAAAGALTPKTPLLSRYKVTVGAGPGPFTSGVVIHSHLPSSQIWTVGKYNV